MEKETAEQGGGIPDHIPVSIIVSFGLHGLDDTLLELLRRLLALDCHVERQEEVDVLFFIPSFGHCDWCWCWFVVDGEASVGWR